MLASPFPQMCSPAYMVHENAYAQSAAFYSPAVSYRAPMLYPQIHTSTPTHERYHHAQRISCKTFQPLVLQHSRTQPYAVKREQSHSPHLPFVVHGTSAFKKIRRSIQTMPTKQPQVRASPTAAAENAFSAALEQVRKRLTSRMEAQLLQPEPRTMPIPALTLSPHSHHSEHAIILRSSNASDCSRASTPTASAITSVHLAPSPSISPLHSKEAHDHESDYSGMESEGEDMSNLGEQLKASLREFRIIMTPEGRRYACNQCPRTFAKPGSLKLHERVHGAIKPFKCKAASCPLRFTHVNSCKKHMQRCPRLLGEKFGGIKGVQDTEVEA